MGKNSRFPGSAVIAISGAFTEGVLNISAASGIKLRNIRRREDCCLELEVPQHSLGEIEKICEKCSCSMEIKSLKGGKKALNFIRRRACLLSALALMAAILAVSSFFVWDIRIEADGNIDREKVLRVLSDCGLEEGTFWPSLSSDTLRCRALAKLPELSWIGLRVSGSRAYVKVKLTRPVRPYEEDAGVWTDLTALHPGKIREVQIFRGRALVSAGDDVKAGQILASGRTESMTSGPSYTSARGRVMAETERELCSVCPYETPVKVGTKNRRTHFAVKFCEKRINLYFCSGKSIDGCDKIIKEYNLGVEGLFTLPLSIVREELVKYETETGACMTERQMEENLLMKLEHEIRGKIVSADCSPVYQDNIMKMRLRALCIENIAKAEERQIP